MEVPLERRVMNIAEYDGVVTVAGERAAGLYHRSMHGPPDEGLGRHCRALSFAERVRCPECIPLMLYEMNVEIIQQNSVPQNLIGRVEALCMPGYSRERMGTSVRTSIDRADGRYAEQLAERLAPYTGRRLLGASLWDDQIMINAIDIREDGRGGPSNATVRLVRPEGADRYYMTLRSDTIPRIPLSVSHNDTDGTDRFPEIDAPPPGARALRYRLDPDSPPDERTGLIVEELPDRGDVQTDDMVLYILEEQFPPDAPPFMDMDPAELDAAGRQFQDAIVAHMLWEIEDEDQRTHAEDALSYWHPKEQEYIRPQVERVLNEDRMHNASGSGVKVSGPNYLNFAPGSGGDFPRTASRMRMASRVMTDNGIAWFAWAPQPDADDPGDVYVRVFFQIRTDDGEYKLLLRGDQEGGGSERDRRALFLLGQRNGNDYPDPADGTLKPDLRDVVGILTRHQREAQLGGE